LLLITYYSASKVTYVMSDGALSSTHSYKQLQTVQISASGTKCSYSSTRLTTKTIDAYWTAGPVNAQLRAVFFMYPRYTLWASPVDGQQFGSHKVKEQS